MGFLLQDVLLLLSLQSRTGELIIESGNNIGTVILHQGTILQAFSPYSRAIGDLLVEAGSITESELLEMLRQQKQIRDHFPIGGLFIKTGRVTFEVIEMMVREQIRQAIKEFMTWKHVTVSFLDKDIQPCDRIYLQVHEFIPPESLKAGAEFCSLIQNGGITSPSASARL